MNVRAGPESGARILLQVNRDEPAVELGREGDWVRVRLPDRDTAGWIHGSLLTTVGQPAAAGAPAASPPARPRREPAPAAARAAPAPPARARPGRGGSAAAVDPQRRRRSTRFRESVT